MPSPSGRAGEVLDRLARDQSRRTLFHRKGPGEPFDQDPSPGHLGARRIASLRVVGAVVAVACAGAFVVALVLDRRSPPVEERLPLASDQLADVAGPGPTSVPGRSEVTAPADGEPPAGQLDAVFVHVGGAVAAPGVVDLPGGSRVVDAVRAAGGLRGDADPDRVNLAAVLEDGQRIVVPVAGQEVPAEILPTGPASPGDGPEGSTDGSSPLIDLNIASAQELESLPGIGPATAAAIVSHREKEGPFGSVDALIDVRGIGEAKLEALRDLVTAGTGT